MYVIKMNNGKYLSKIDREGILFSSFVENAISSPDRDDLVHLYDFLVSYLNFISSFEIVKLSEEEESYFFNF